MRVFSKTHTICWPSQWKKTKQNSSSHLKETERLQEAPGLLQSANHPTMGMDLSWSSHKLYLSLSALSLKAKYLSERTYSSTTQTAQREVQTVYPGGNLGPPKSFNDAGHIGSSELPDVFFSQCLMAVIAAFCLQALTCSSLVQKSQSTCLGIVMPQSFLYGPKFSLF